MLLNASTKDQQRALLMVWTDIPSVLEVGFNDWYNREHMRERVNLPGFIRGRRFEAVSSSPKYLVLYDVQSADVLFSEPYLNLKKNRDPRTLQFGSAFTNSIKGTCDVLAHAGAGEGGLLALLPFRVEVGKTDGFRRWLSESFCREIVKCPGVATATYASSNDYVRKHSAPHDMRSTDRHIGDAVLIEASNVDSISTALSRLTESMAGHGARAHLIESPSIFRLMYSLTPESESACPCGNDLPKR